MTTGNAARATRRGFLHRGKRIFPGKSGAGEHARALRRGLTSRRICRENRGTDDALNRYSAEFSVIYLCRDSNSSTGERMSIQLSPSLAKSA